MKPGSMINTSTFKMKNLVRCTRCNNCYHGACCRADPQLINIKERTVKGTGKIAEATFECRFCDQQGVILDYELPCSICGCGGIKNADVVDQSGVHTKAHLICALFSSRLRISDLDSFTFEHENNNDVVQLLSECEFCNKEIQADGLTCKKLGCRKTTHIRCALLRRSDILIKNRDTVCKFMQEKNIAYNAFKGFWLVSLGLFEKNGQWESQRPVSESDLKSNKAFSAMMNLKDHEVSSSLINEFKFGVLNELNFEIDRTMVEERIKIDELSLSFSCYCSDHKDNISLYCLCGVNEEKIDIMESEKRNVDSIFCDECGIWYHKDCIHDSTVQQGDLPEYYECPKCKRIEELDGNPKKIAKAISLELGKKPMLNWRGKGSNFMEERSAHLLKRDNIFVIDYLMVLRASSKNITEISSDFLSYLEEEVPFSILFLRRLKYEKHILPKLIRKHTIGLLKKIFFEFFKSISQEASSLDEIDIDDFNSKYLDLKVKSAGVKDLLEGDIEEFDDFMASINLIGGLFGKLKTKTIRLDELSILVSKLDSLSMIRGTNLEGIFAKHESILAKAIEKAGASLKIFLKIVENTDIFELKKTSFDNIETFGVVIYSTEDTLSRTLLEHMRHSYQKDNIKKVANCNSVQNLKENLLVAIKSLYFTDFETLDRVTEYIDHYKATLEWRSKFGVYKQRLIEMKILAATDFYMEDDYKVRFLQLEEIQSLLRIESKYKRLLDSQEILRLREAEKNAKEKAKNTKDLLENFLKKGIALNKHNLLILSKYCIKMRGESISRGAISVSEEEFIQILQEYEPHNDRTYQKLMKIEKLRKRILEPDFVMKLPKEKKYDTIVELYEEYAMCRLKGPCFQKLQSLRAPILWVDGLMEAFKAERKLDCDIKRNDFIYNYPTRYLYDVTETILERYMFAEADGDINAITKKFRPYPELKQIVFASMRKYYENLVSQFKDSDKISISLALKVNNLRYILDVSDADDVLFNKRCGSVKDFVFDTVNLIKSERVGLADFLAEVSSLYKRGERFKDFPEFESSFIKRCVEWLNQARIIAQALKEIKKFKGQEDITPDKFKKYCKIYELINNPSFHKINIINEEVNNSNMAKFSHSMQECLEIKESWERLLEQANQIAKDSSAPSLAKRVQARIEKFLMLPPAETAIKLLKRTEEYDFLLFVKNEIIARKSQLDNFRKHLHELFDNSSLLKSSDRIGKNFTKENLNEFQAYLQKYFFERARHLKFIDQQTKELMIVIRLANYAIRAYLKEETGIDNLDKALCHYRKVFSNELVSTRGYIERLGIDQLIESKLNNAIDLKRRFFSSSELSAEHFWEIYDAVEACKVNIVDKDKISPEFNKNIERYKKIIKVIRECWTNKYRLEGLISKEEIEYANSFVLSKELYQWAMEQFSERSTGNKWVNILNSTRRPLGAEVEMCLALRDKLCLENTPPLQSLKQSMEKALIEYRQIQKEAKRLTATEIIDRLRETPVEFIEKDLAILIEFITIKLTNDPEQVEDYPQAIEAFNKIYELCRKGPEHSLLQELGATKVEIKEEIKEEALVKEEYGVEPSIANCNPKFRDVLRKSASVVYSSYKRAQELKNAIIATINTIHSLKSPSAQKSLSKIETFLRKALRESQQPEGALVAKLKLEKVVEEIRDHFEDPSKSIQFLSVGCEYFESIDGSRIKDDRALKLPNFCKPLLKRAASLIVIDVQKLIRKYLGITPPGKISASNKRSVVKEEAQSSTKKSRRESFDNYSLTERKEEKRHTAPDFEQLLKGKVHKNMMKYFDSIPIKEFECLVNKMTEEISQKKTQLKIEEIFKTIKGLRLNKAGQSTVANQLLAKLAIGIGEDETLIEMFMNFDLHTLNRQKLRKGSASKMLTKRKPSNFEAPTQIFKKLKGVNELVMPFMDIFVKEKNGMSERIEGMQFATKISPNKLSQMLVPDFKTKVTIQFKNEMPLWVLESIKHIGKEYIIYGTLEGTIPKLPMHTIGGEFDGGLGGLQFFISQGSQLEEKLLERLGYSKQKYINSYFFILDLTELSLKKGNIGTTPLEYRDFIVKKTADDRIDDNLIEGKDPSNIKYYLDNSTPKKNYKQNYNEGIRK